MSVGVTADSASTADFERWVRGLHADRPHGTADRVGSLNYIDDAARVRARESIRTGETVSLAAPVKEGRTATGAAGAFRLTVSHLTNDHPARDIPDGFAMQTDAVELDCHGHANTHIDALNHLAFYGTWYDHSPSRDPNTGCSLLDIAKSGIFTRAVHADVAAARGQRWIEPGQEVTGEDIDAALARSGVRFEPGDALLLDCGRDVLEQERAPWGSEHPIPGAGPGVSRWLAAHQPGLLCWDMLDGHNAEGVVGPVHQLHWAVGLVLVDNAYFGQARSALASQGRADAALVVAPLPIDGATGGNVNPLLLI